MGLTWWQSGKAAAGDVFVLLGPCPELGLPSPGPPPVLSLAGCHGSPLLSKGDSGVVETAFLAPHSCRHS